MLLLGFIMITGAVCIVGGLLVMYVDYKVRHGDWN